MHSNGTPAVLRVQAKAVASCSEPNQKKDGLLNKIGPLETAAHVYEGLTSPGLQPPKPPLEE